ncbi:MAG: hypothetical protein V3S08_08230, partial [Phycisphaerales bacterium]
YWTAFVASASGPGPPAPPAPTPGTLTVMHETWTASTAATWETMDLSGAPYNVPAEAVVEIAVTNSATNAELWGGVRAYGSTLERRMQLHEAEGGGTDVIVVHVQTDASSRIEHYAQTTADIGFIILGYWAEGRYVEHYIELDADQNNVWLDHDLATYGVGPGDVAEIVLNHKKGNQEREFGVRTNGSGLSRLMNAHETESNGVETATMHVVADATDRATVELYCGNANNVNPILFGHWSTPPGTYTELFTDIGGPTASATWESKDLTSFSVPVDAVVEIILVNTQFDAEANMGVRDNGGSAARLLDLQEAENAAEAPSSGGDFGRMHTLADAASTVEIYDEDITKTHQFLLTGYWEPQSAVALAEHDAGQQPDAFTEIGAAMGAELFGFELDPFGDTANVNPIVFSISTITGLTDLDWTSVQIAVDDNGDGAIGGGETTTVGGAGVVDQAAGTITFSTTFSVSTATNYILVADFVGLDTGDMVTVTLDDSNITSSITVDGAATPVIHREGCFYFERQEQWHVATINSWETKDLSGYPYYVPANAVLEIAMQNLKANVEHSVGVRAVGSVLERLFTLHEAEGGGMDVVVMQVQADASSQIQYKASLDRHVTFNLLGYWDCGTYVEAFQQFTAGTADTWEAENLAPYGVASDEIVDVVLVNTDTANTYNAGTRNVGTSHERKLSLHPAEAGGVEVASMTVQADSTANAAIEIYAENTTGVQFYLVGRWSTAPMPYKQMYASIGSPTASATWETVDLTSFAGESGVVADVLMTNLKANRENNMGVRRNGSKLHRVMKLQEAEPSGGDHGRALVVIDNTRTIEFYHNDITHSHDFIMLGYWGTTTTQLITWQEIAPH